MADRDNGTAVPRMNISGLPTPNTTVFQQEPERETDDVGPVTWDDATWILTSAFIIFTMQSGKWLPLCATLWVVLEESRLEMYSCRNHQWLFYFFTCVPLLEIILVFLHGSVYSGLFVRLQVKTYALYPSALQLEQNLRSIFPPQSLMSYHVKKICIW